MLTYDESRCVIQETPEPDSEGTVKMLDVLCQNRKETEVEALLASRLHGDAAAYFTGSL